MEITLHRSRLQEVHKVVRHLADRRSSSPLSNKVLVRAEPGRVSVLATNGDVDVLYQVPAPENAATGHLIVPVAALAESAKGGQGPAQLTGKEANPADLEKYTTPILDVPKRLHHADWPTLRQHLRNAGDVVSSQPDRYSINRLGLRQEGVVATDGRQLYAGKRRSDAITCHHGVETPWRMGCVRRGFIRRIPRFR